MKKSGEWDALSELLNVQKRMNSLFESALARSNFETQDGFDSWTPVCDAFATEQGLVLYLELPGLEQNLIDLRVEGDDLIVEGERKMEREQEGERFHRVERSFGKFSRRFHLPSTVDRDAVQASYREGVLKVELPNRGKKHPESIKVSIG
jgi:HSP20 family protein